MEPYLPWIIDILLIAAAAAMILIGVARGFIKTVVESAKLVASIVLAVLLGGLVGNFFQVAFVENVVREPVHNWVDETVTAVSEELNVDGIMAELPDFILGDDLRAEIEEATSQESRDAMVADVTEAITKPLSIAISKVMGYAVVFLVAFLALSVVAWLLNKWAESNEVVNTVNRILGGVLGGISAVITLLLVSSVIRMFWGDADFYQNSILLKFLGNLTSYIVFLNIENWIAPALGR